MNQTPHAPRIEITYCTQCRWMLRAAWFAQELLTTFSVELGEIALVPGTGGTFGSMASSSGHGPSSKDFPTSKNSNNWYAIELHQPRIWGIRIAPPMPIYSASTHGVNYRQLMP